MSTLQEEIAKAREQLGLRKERSMPPQTNPLLPSTPTGPPPRRAGIKVIPAPAEYEERIVPSAIPSEESSTLLPVRRATRVFETPTEEGEAEGTLVTDDFTPEERKKLDEVKASEGGLEKAHIHLQRKLGEQGTTITALGQQVQDMLAASTTATTQAAALVPPPDVAAMQKDLDAIATTFLDDIPGNIKKLTELNVKMAQASVAPLLRQKDQQAQQDAAQALLLPYPGLVTTKADGAYVDAYVAALPGGSTSENYQKGLAHFATVKAWTKPTASASPNAEVEAMKTEASTQAPVATPVKPKGKIWRRSELEALQIQYPQKYRDLQPEIMKAYKEGRVRT